MFQTLNAHHQEANCIDAASGIVLCKQVSCLKLLEYNLLHCLQTITPSDIFQLSASGVIDLLYVESRMGVPSLM